MKRDWNAMAQGILDAVGGPENISGMTHCATRLRLNLKDDAACDDAAVKEVEGVVNTLNKAGQYQVLIGTEVPKLYEKFEPLVKGSGAEISAATKDEGESIVSQVFSAISGIFAPLLPAMTGSGILRGFVILAAQLGIIAEGSGTYTILYTLAMSVFYFLPVLLGFSAGKRFGASPYLSALICACLLYPDFIALMGDTGNGAMTDLFGIPVVLMSYNSTVIPAILASWAYSFLYKWLDEHVSEMLKLVVLPAVSLLVMVPLTMIVIGCALGVFLKARDQKLRTFSMTGVISIALSAIIEPTLFGMLVQNKKLWLAQIISGAAGGAFCGLMGVVTTAFTFGSVTTFPAFVSSDAMNFAWAMVGMLIAFAVSAVLGFVFCDKEQKLA